MSAPDTQDRELVISRVIAAPRELVWTVWTTPAHFQQWWGPEGFTITAQSFDLRVGGGWKHYLHGAGQDFPNKITFLEVVPPSRLSYEHGDFENVMFVSTITFEEVDGGTLVTMRALFPSKELRDENVEKNGSIEGGEQHLAKLAEYVEELK